MRTHHAASIGEGQIGERVTVAGWIQRRRDHGGIAFLDIRDASGIIQVVADPAVQPEVGDLRMEYCVSIAGTVRRRPEGTENPEMATGTVEIGVEEIVVLSAAEALPFMIDDRTEVDERARLRYRYLDLRRPRMAANLRARSRATAAIRRTLDDAGVSRGGDPDFDQQHPGRGAGHVGSRHGCDPASSTPCPNRPNCSSNS